MPTVVLNDRRSEARRVGESCSSKQRCTRFEARFEGWLQVVADIVAGSGGCSGGFGGKISSIALSIKAQPRVLELFYSLCILYIYIYTLTLQEDL